MLQLRHAPRPSPLVAPPPSRILDEPPRYYAASVFDINQYK